MDLFPCFVYFINKIIAKRSRDAHMFNHMVAFETGPFQRFIHVGLANINKLINF